VAGMSLRFFNALGLDAARQRALWRVRVKLTLRQFSRQPGKIVGLVVSALFFVPLVLGAAFGSAIGYLNLPQPWPAQLLGGVLVLLWLIWLVAPALAFRLNEGLDLTRLLTYPLPSRDLVASTLLGTLLDFPTYLALPIFVAVGVGWGANWRWPFVIVALLVAYAHMVLTSQLVLTAAGGLLRSRRFRDVSIVVLSLLGSSCYFINQGVQVLFRNLDTRQLVGIRPLTYLQWLPPGATARAIERASAGDWSAALLWLLYATLLLGGVAWLWWRLLLRVVTGEGFLQAPVRASSAPVQAAPRRVGMAGRHPFLRWMPDDIHQLFIKELKAMWRFPQRRIGLIQGFLAPLFVIVAIFFTRGMPEVEVTPWWALTVMGYAIFTMWIASLNMLGWEGKALPMLLGTPIPRQQIFLAKSGALLLMVAVPLTLFGLMLTIGTRSWFGIAGWLAAMGASLATMGVNAVASVLFPSPVNLESTSRQNTLSGGGCTTALANTFLVPIAIGLVNLPLLAIFGVAYWWQIEWLVGAGALVALLYGTGALALGVQQAERLMLPREAEIIEATRASEM